MSFEIVEVTRVGLPNPLPKRHTSITRGGSALFHAADLTAAGIAEAVVLLADPGSLRIGLRAPRSGEGKIAARVSVTKRNGKPIVGKRTVHLTPAIRKVGLTPPEVVGRYELTAKDPKHKGLLVINLMGEDDAKTAKS